ncbi:MAG: hypothetical protein P4L84_29230, partial [Isosphaeraceae bacterium]|nr:hypothetical protein [Isosphaeraceae bacterium]
AIMPSDTRPEAWAWWAEKDDVVIALDKPDTADAVIDVIDGKKASAVDQPTRIELAKTDNGFLPVGLAFLDSAGVPAPKGAGETARAQLAGVQRIDYRWGFDGDALMTAWRLVAPGPRQGALALVDGPKFSLKALPPMTDGVEGFTAVSLDLPETYDRLMALAKTANPEATEKADQAVATLKSKYKIDLRKDVLAQLGPRIAYFVAPGKLAATSAAGSEKADAGAGGGIPNPLTMMLAAVEVPKFALVVEVKNATAFGKKLDELMIAVNKILRESVKATAAAAGNTGGEGDSAPAERKRGGGPGVPAPKFEMMAGKAKAYALVLPAEMGKLPAGVKPTIRVGEKFVAIGVNPAVAGQALEAKEGWKPSGEFTSALASTPEGLVLLNVSDPRGTMPQELASLPRSLQTAINSAIQTALSGGMPGAAGAQPGSPGGFPGSSLRPNSPPTIPPPQTSASSPPPGGSSFPGAPNGAAGFPGAPGGANGAPAMGIVLKVDPAKLPSADALKALLFPGYAALSVNDQEIRYVTREAFPNISFGGGTGSPGASMILGPALQKAREAATKQMAAQAKGNVTPPPATAGEKPK